MLTTETDELDGVWRALANPVRRRMLDALKIKPHTTGELVDLLEKVSRFSVMQHLRVLEEGNLVIRRRSGRNSYCYLNPIPLQQIHQRWVSSFQQPWAEALVALKSELEHDHENTERKGRSA